LKQDLLRNIHLCSAYWRRINRRSAKGARPMSLSTTETFLRNAKQQLSQTDINQSLIRAVADLLREVKNMENELHRVKRSIQMSRRF
jgi:hypothetical protein